MKDSFSNAPQCGKDLPTCSTCSRLGKACFYPRPSSQTSAVLPSNQGPLGQLHQQYPDGDRRLSLEDLQTSRLESGQYQKVDPVPSFTAVNHAKQPLVLPCDQQPVMPPESRLQTSSQPLVSSTPKYPIEPAVEQHPEKAASTPSMPPPPKTAIQQMHEQGFVKPLSAPSVDLSKDDPMIMKEVPRRVEENIGNHQTSIAERKSAWKIALNDDWANTRLSRTLIHIRAGNSWDNIIAMDLGSSRDVDDFFARVSRQLGTLIIHLSILLPGNVAKLDKYVVQIKQGDQVAFEKILGILLEEIGRLGVTQPVRYVLAGTATCR